jgi:solute carrier family 25 folate transporter 32
MFYPSVDHAIAGMTAGFLTTLGLHPLDVVKTRLQSTSQFSPFNIRYNNLYAGLSPNLLGSTASWGLYFLFYSYLKDESSSSSPFYHLKNSAIAGAITSLFTNPIWVVKTRTMCGLDANKIQPSGMFRMLKTIYFTEGIRGLYSGFIPSLFGVSHGAIQFMVYEDLKSRLGGSKLSNVEYISLAAFSKTIATMTTYPYQTVRTRLQLSKGNLSLLNTIKEIFKRDGVLGFYRGLFVNIIRVLPATCMTFVIYERTAEYLKYFNE